MSYICPKFTESIYWFCEQDKHTLGKIISGKKVQNMAWAEITKKQQSHKKIFLGIIVTDTYITSSVP